MKKNTPFFLLILSTLPSLKLAEKIATVLVKEKLAACVNISAKIQSVYEWEGKLRKEAEHLLFIKTKRSLYKKLEARLKELHPYEVPEILALPIERGSKAYLDWVKKQTL